MNRIIILILISISMNLSAQNTNYPKWLDRAEYPFENNYFELSIGLKTVPYILRHFPIFA
jgi:hypothetical protein